MADNEQRHEADLDAVAEAIAVPEYDLVGGPPDGLVERLDQVIADGPHVADPEREGATRE